MVSIRRWMSRVRWEVQHDHRHTAFDGRLYLERRPKLSPNWFTRCWLTGKPLSRTTKSPVLADAKEFAERWFTKLLHKLDNGESIAERTVEDAYTAFIHWHERDLLVTGASNAKKIKNYKSLWNGLKPFMGDTRLSDVTSQTLETFRSWRIETSKVESKRTLTEKTLHNYAILTRLILKYAVRHGWLAQVPQFPQQKLRHDHPEWLTPSQLHTLLVTSQSRIGSSSTAGNAAKHVAQERTELHAFVLLMVGGCVRVDECLNLRWEDLTPHPDNDKVPPFKRQVRIDIRKGKTGERQGIGNVSALTAMNYLKELHPDAKPGDRLFTSSHSRGMAKLLTAAGLRFDGKGKLPCCGKHRSSS
jgi:integrase